jgi:hypothetical protein
MAGCGGLVDLAFAIAPQPVLATSVETETALH